MKLKHFFDNATFTITYVIYDEASGDAVIVDPVLNYNPAGAHISFEGLIQLTEWLDSQRLTPRMILETHAHADHLSSAQYLKLKYPAAKLAISSDIVKVQATFKDIFALEELRTDGSQYDILLDENKEYDAGTLRFHVLHTPGHTPACACFVFGEWAFVGDLIFMPDFGTGRCDFPDGSAVASYHSIMHKLYKLPDATVLYVGHDYMPKGRPLEFKTTVKEQKAHNIHITAETTEEQFVTFRTNRDKELSPPRLLYESVQFNINGGDLPASCSNGRRFFRIPLTIAKTPI